MKARTQPYSSIITVAASLNQLAVIRDFVSVHAVAFGFKEQVVNQITLAVDEACSNVIRHAYNQDSNQTIRIQIEEKNKEFMVSIFDSAESFDPTKVASPNMEEYFRSFKHGGLGVHIIKKVMDDIMYIPADAQHPLNELRLTKKLATV